MGPREDDSISHRVIEEWMGTPVETLADLIPEPCRAMCVGINPAPPSVAAGHYYQGRAGQAFFRRLRMVGLLGTTFDGFEDDALFAVGVGFTDLVKRPTARAADLTAAELQHGRRALLDKLETAGAPLVIFTFKKSAVTLLGGFRGNGFLHDLTLGPSSVFVMPGPMEPRPTADATLNDLRAYLVRKSA